ncbi:hypothetical protein ACJVC5_13060 [Peredibacter sp. HCB2-198]|uniref:hypothetical protein n=1 Tax=Peredibacter sp. HCB2-198 TaxID=3383025 RepID=UPI0038B54367
MKSKSLLVLACLFSAPVFAQNLPDEINYGPYETRYRILEKEVSAAQAQLNTSRASLQEAQKFIAEMSQHLSDLRDQIQAAEEEIAALEIEIPELERRISILQSERARAENDIRNLQYQQSQLESRYQGALRDMRPLEDSIARKEQRYRELHSDRTQLQRQENEAQTRLRRANSEAQQIDRAVNEEYQKKKQMEQELANAQSRISSLEGEISRTESTVNSLNASLGSERGKLLSLESRVQEYQAQVNRLRSAGAPAAEIQDAERKLGAATNARNSSANEVRRIEGELNRSQAQVRTQRSQLEEVRRNQAALPGRIAQAQGRIDKLTVERRQVKDEIDRSERQLAQVRSAQALNANMMAVIQQELSNLQADLQRQRQYADSIARDAQNVRSQIEGLSQHSRHLSSQIAQASERIRSNQATIPRLQQNIRADEQEITQGESDLARGRTDERTFTLAVVKDEAKLADLTRSRDSAQNEMSTRRDLYQRYLTEAETLGAGQADTGTTLGRAEGARLSLALAKQNGVAVGQEMGRAEARYWGSVRGEIQGHDLGYSEGLASVEDRTRAIQEAGARAAQDAELFAQRNFKPVFFEEFVQAEFKKPMNSALKALKMVHVNFTSEEFHEGVAPLTPAELSRSEELKTPLDASIMTAAEEVKTVEARALRISEPEVAFQVPTKIPFGTVACSQVYKNLAVYKAACEGAYKDTFTNNYVSATREEFSQSYQRQFQSEFDAADVAQREASFPQELSEATKIGRAEGTRIGKIEIYQRTYESTYKASYEVEIVKAKEKSKGDAARELQEYLQVKPLLTVASTSLAADNFRGGEELSLVGKVKNVSSVALNAPVMVRVTEVINGQKIDSEVVLNSASPLSLTDLPTLKLKVNDSARAGEKVIVRGVVELPGDLYRAVRQEKFELVQTLSANPAHDLGTNYNKTPDIKGVFRRNIHFMTVKVTPKIEEIKEGYEVILKAVGENASLIDQNETSLRTGAVTQNTGKDVRFSYTFKDAAKGKTITLELSVVYAGKVLKKESIVLLPH